MNRRSINIILVVAVLIFSAFNAAPTLYKVPLPGNTKFFVVINKSVGLKDPQLSIEMIRAYLKGEKTKWPNKSKVNLSLMKSSTLVGKEIAQNILNMTPLEYDKFYLSMVFSGKITSPKMFSNEADLQSYVSGLEGAVGVISAKEGERKDPKFADAVFIPIN